MSLSLGIDDLKVELDTVEVYIPDNDLARLMYYLDCVFTVIKYDEEKRLTDYKNYYLLTKEEKILLLT